MKPWQITAYPSSKALFPNNMKPGALHFCNAPGLLVQTAFCKMQFIGQFASLEKACHPECSRGIYALKCI